MHKDTPPASPNMNNTMEDEDMIYIGDVDEVVEAYDASETPEDEAMESEIQVPDNASQRFTGHKSGSVFCGSLTKNGKLAVTGGEEDKAYLWDVTTGQSLLECTGHKDSVIFAEFNYDESYLATGDMSGIIQVWKLPDYECVWEYTMGDATWMKWHMTANVLLAGSVEGEVYMWKVPEGICKVFQGTGCRAEVASLLPDGKRIAVGYEDGAIRVIDLKTSTVLASVLPMTGHSSTITALDCHPDNNLILSAAVDGKTILSTPHTGKIVCILQSLNTNVRDSTGDNDQEAGASKSGEDSNWVETAAFCKDPGFQVAATGTVNGEIFIWDIPKQVLKHKIDQDSGISKLVWKGNSSLLFSAGLDGILRCFDAKTTECIRLFTGHTADILDLYISENGEKALTTSDDSTARIFDIASLP